MGISGILAIVFGLVITVAIGLVILLMVALPSLRAEGRIRTSPQRFRLPSEWTGYDDDVHGFFGRDEETSHLATREQAAVTVMQEHAYVLRPQPGRHSAPPVWSMRPRTRHWKVPATGTGFRTALTMLFS